MSWSLILLFFFSTASSCSVSQAQTVSNSSPSIAPDVLRLERIPVAGGAELITIHAKLSGLQTSANGPWIPMVTILRDTLGDAAPENDRLRYVWPLTYTRPTLGQRVLGAVPFLYSRVANKNSVSEKAPPPVFDLGSPDREVWNRIFWTALQSLLLDPYGAPIKASTRSYRENISDYRRSHIVRALSVLTLYQAFEQRVGLKDPQPAPFTEQEFAEIQARLLLTDKALGGLVDSLQLSRYHERTATDTLDERGHNWEMLRQRAEAESLYFEPLLMPDGSATHGLIWIAKEDLAARRGRPYSKRFLNIDNPWTDKRLVTWHGYVETRFFDSDHRAVSPDQPGARKVEMIPLALYGLDHPKIPMLLVDFRDGLNPKKREMSRRMLQDVTRNVLSLSRFGDIPYFLGRTVFDFVTGRRGMDLNQPSRLRTYSQLKLLLALNESLDPELRDDISHRVEKVSLNPLENDLEAEANLARQQYAALLSYATSADGLPAKLNRDRRAELVAEAHPTAERALFRLGNVLSFGKYTHREGNSPDLESRLDVARQLTYHTRFLREVAQSSPQIDVLWNLDDVRRSLRYIANHGPQAKAQAISATVKIFEQTQDEETRRTCLESLSRFDNPKAKKQLILISQTKDLDPAWKQLIASYLDNPRRVEPLASSDSTTRRNRPGQQ